MGHVFVVVKVEVDDTVLDSHFWPELSPLSG